MVRSTAGTVKANCTDCRYGAGSLAEKSFENKKPSTKGGGRVNSKKGFSGICCSSCAVCAFP